MIRKGDRITSKGKTGTATTDTLPSPYGNGYPEIVGVMWDGGKRESTILAKNAKILVLFATVNF